MRRPYLDNIRWAAVHLVLVYHVVYLLNAIGIPGGVGAQTDIKAFDVLLYFVYPWLMVLLFIVAGVSARYALEKRSHKEFLKGRAVKLLIPSTLGLLAYQWISGYLNLRLGGGLPYIPSFLIYPVSVVSGIGPLWFAHMLFLFSALLVPIRKLDPRDRLWRLGGRIPFGGLLLLVLPLWGAAQLLNAPLLIMYRFGIYGFSFLAGYFFLSHGSVLAAVEKRRVPLLIAAILLGVGYVIRYFGENYVSASCLQSLFTNLYAWIAVLAVLGCAKAWWDRETRFSNHMAGMSFGLYVLHYPIVLAACCFLYHYCKFPSIVNYAAALAAVLVSAPLLYGLLRRIPVVRFWVLGITKRDAIPGKEKASL